MLGLIARFLTPLAPLTIVFVVLVRGARAILSEVTGYGRLIRG